MTIMPAEVFKILRGHPDRVFTTAQLCAMLKLDADVWDNRASVIWCVSKLYDYGKIEFRWPVGSKGMFGYVWPAPIEIDAITGRKFKWTADGRRWVDELIPAG